MLRDFVNEETINRAKAAGFDIILRDRVKHLNRQKLYMRALRGSTKGAAT